MNKSCLTCLIIILGLIGIVSCTDNNTNPTTNKTYFPLKTGNSWTYENYKLDNSGQRKTETRYVDSIAVTGTITKLNKNAFILTTYEDGKQTDENYFYTESSKYYAHSSYVQPDLSSTQFKFPFSLDDEWLLVADPNAVEWPMTTKQVSNVDFPVPNLGTAKINGSLSIKGQMGGIKALTIGGLINNASAQEFKVIYSFDGKITLGFIPLDLKFTVNVHHWYVENVGLVQTIMDPLKITIPSIYSVDIDGSESLLINASNVNN